MSPQSRLIGGLNAPAFLGVGETVAVDAQRHQVLPTGAVGELIQHGQAVRPRRLTAEDRVCLDLTIERLALTQGLGESFGAIIVRGHGFLVLLIGILIEGDAQHDQSSVVLLRGRRRQERPRSHDREEKTEATHGTDPDKSQQ
jgi:hypothetical protein